MPRRSTWFWVLLLAGTGFGAVRLWQLFSGFGGPERFMQALGHAPETPEPVTTRLALPQSKPPPSSETRPQVTYTTDEAKDPLANLLLVKKASPPASSKTNASGESTNLNAQVPMPAAPKIQGLMWGGFQPQAVIDGTVYMVGDTVQGAKIVAIDHTGITAEFQGQQIHWALESRGK